MRFQTFALFGLATAIAFSAGFYVAWHRDNFIFQAVKSASARFRPWNRTEIVLLGDSITASGKWKELFPRAEIENEGVAGEGTAAVLARLDDVLRLRPRAVFVMVGVNDVTRGVPVGEIAANYRAIIDRLAPHTALTVQSTLMTRDAKLNETINAVNGVVEKHCRQKPRCSFLDLNARFAPDGMLRLDLSPDGIHLNEAGYREWAAQLPIG